MSKRKTKLTRSNKTIIWKRELAGVPRIDISDEINVTTTLIKLFLEGKYKKEADNLWSEQIKKVGYCEVCGSRTRQLNAHHIINRTRGRFRHDLSNGVCLCVTCHTFGSDCCPHGGLDAVLRFNEWLKANRPGQYDWFMENKDDKRLPDISYEQAYYMLKED